VFQDLRKRRELNLLLHPLIRQEVAAWARSQAGRKPFPPLVVVEVPLLFEGGYYRWFDGTVSISAPREVRQKRLAGRGWSLLEIRSREAAQWSQRRKDLAADRVIYNRGSLKGLKWSVEDWLRKVRSAR
jgi:dephospho-CoA kinase